MKDGKKRAKKDRYINFYSVCLEKQTNAIENVKYGSKGGTWNNPILELYNEWIKYTSPFSFRLAQFRSLSNKRIFFSNYLIFFELLIE